MLKDIDEIFANTKILATLGPATSDRESIMKLIKAGIDGIRLNFSHGDHNFFRDVFKNIEEAKKEIDMPAAVLIDLRGPKIRIGKLAEDSLFLHEGDTLEITIDETLGTKEKISTSYLLLPSDAEVGKPVLIDDGLIRLRIIEKKERSVICIVEEGGRLKPNKGMNLPGMKLSAPSVSGKDIRDLEFALQFGINYIALSFVRSPDDIQTLRNWLNERDYDIPLIAKIEKREAVDNFDAILAVADGIMVARGDLGVEMEPDEVPIVQKIIIQKCNEAGKPVITATQMLESMVHNPIPTRAEASDVANAVWDGTDVVMLSAETSVGNYPIKTVKTMNNILRRAELHRLNMKKIQPVHDPIMEVMLFDSVNKGVADISCNVKAAAIIVFTVNGRTARSISKFRPRSKIIAFSKSKSTADSLSLHWGVIPFYCKDIDEELENIEKAKQIIVDSGMVNEGDVLLFTAGAPYSEKGRMNLLRLDVV